MLTLAPGVEQRRADLAAIGKNVWLGENRSLAVSGSRYVAPRIEQVLHLVAMAVKEFGIRELRNHTNALLDALDHGHEVYITRRGTRVAELRVPQPISEIDRLLADAERLPGIDTGMYDELFEAKTADLAAQVDRDSLWR